MKRNILITVILFLLICTFSSCSRKFNSRVQNLVYLEEAEALSGEISDERLAEIKASVRDLEEILDARVDAAKDLGNYYRILAGEFMYAEMFGLALENYREALTFYPSSFTLYYHAGICAARMSLTAVDSAQRLDYLYQAESYYKSALQLNRGYYEVTYALAVLYFYEFELPAEAEPLLRELTENHPGDVDSLFLMGAVQASLGNREEAIYYYEAIPSATDDKGLIEQAMENRNALMGGM